MHDTDTRPAHPGQPASTAAVPGDQSRALLRRQALDEQQRAFRPTYPAPHMLRRRPPG